MLGEQNNKIRQHQYEQAIRGNDCITDSATILFFVTMKASTQTSSQVGVPSGAALFIWPGCQELLRLQWFYPSTLLEKQSNGKLRSGSLVSFPVSQPMHVQASASLKRGLTPRGSRASEVSHEERSGSDSVGPAPCPSPHVNCDRTNPAFSMSPPESSSLRRKISLRGGRSYQCVMFLVPSQCRVVRVRGPCHVSPGQAKPATPAAHLLQPHRE